MNELAVVTTILIQCINSLNSELPENKKLSPTHETLLLAEGSNIDSLQLISVIVDFEEALAIHFKVQVSLTTDDAMSLTESPFYNVNSLANYAFSLISK